MVSLSFLQFLVADPDLRGGVSFGQGVGWGLPGGGGGGGGRRAPPRDPPLVSKQ